MTQNLDFGCKKAKISGKINLSKCKIFDLGWKYLNLGEKKNQQLYSYGFEDVKHRFQPRTMKTTPVIKVSELSPLNILQVTSLVSSSVKSLVPVDSSLISRGQKNKKKQKKQKTKTTAIGFKRMWNRPWQPGYINQRQPKKAGRWEKMLVNDCCWFCSKNESIHDVMSSSAAMLVVSESSHKSHHCQVTTDLTRSVLLETAVNGTVPHPLHQWIFVK